MEEKESKRNFFKDFSDKFKNIFNFKHAKTILVAVLAVVVVIIFASSFMPTKTRKTSNNSTNTNSYAMEYCKLIENKLENVLSSVKGAGNVKVMVMVDSSPTIKYLEEKDETTTTQGDGKVITETNTTVVFSKDGSSSKPIIVVEILPKITGVLIIASGAKDLKMKTTLTNVVSSVLGANISNVEVLEGK